MDSQLFVILVQKFKYACSECRASASAHRRVNNHALRAVALLQLQAQRVIYLVTPQNLLQ